MQSRVHHGGVLIAAAVHPHVRHTLAILMTKRKTLMETLLEKHTLARDAFDLAKAKVLPLLPANRKDDFTLERHQGYVLRVVQRVSYLADRLEAMDQSIIFLSSYQASQRWRSKFGRAAYLKYHNEAFVMSAIAVLDRCLHLVAVVFDLGLPDRKVSRFAVLQNKHVDESKVAKPLKEFIHLLESKKLLTIRNEAMHHTSYSDEGLELLEMTELLSQSSDDQSADAHLWTPQAIRDRHADYAYFRRHECQTIAGEIRDKCAALLESLHSEFQLKYRLKESGLI